MPDEDVVTEPSSGIADACIEADSRCDSAMFPPGCG